MLPTNFSIPNTPRILLADDQQDVLEALRLLLKGEGFATESVNSPAAVIKALSTPREREFDLMLMDLNYTRDTTSGMEGLELIEQVRQLDDTLPVVVMTAWGSIELAVETMREGGCDFIQKPWDNDRLLNVLRAQLERGRKLRKEKQERLAYERFQRFEFEEARRIQESLLPTRLPKIEGLEIAVTWQPMREVSGDYFDVIKLDDGKIAICLADVEGKGLPAAMLMSNLQAAVRSLAPQALTPGEMVERLNRTMLQNSSGQKLITMFYAVIDAPNGQGGKMGYVNAGHLPPMLVRQDGSQERLFTGGAMLHIFADSSFETAEIELTPGDRLLVFTDGVVECNDSSGDDFGEDRLLQALLDHRTDNAEMLLQTVKRTVTEFSGGNFQDDMTMIALCYQSRT
jgi:sigma-B regulation protein RsbU (phosphoserine phosphatase)